MHVALREWYLDAGLVQFPVDAREQIGPDSQPQPNIGNEAAKLEIKSAVAETPEQNSRRRLS